jgi:hypothetical protein
VGGVNECLRSLGASHSERLQSLGMTKSTDEYAKAVEGKRHFKDGTFELL